MWVAVLTVCAVLSLPLLYLYGIDALSVLARGRVPADETLNVTTDSGGLASLDRFLDAFAKANGLRVSTAARGGYP
jgi:hypothetical protein